MFGAIAEFSRDPQEAMATAAGRSVLSAVTSRGGFRITISPGTRLIASESITRESWSHRVALCLRERDCIMSRRDVLTELGPDHEAVRTGDRQGVLFDLGLGALQVDACIRVSDQLVAAKLRDLAGRNVFEAGNPAMSIIVPHSPHRVFLSRLGRVEVFQPIPPSHGQSPDGPHTHVLPDLLRHRRTHAATEQIPDGLIPCAHLYPAHPTKDALGNPVPYDGRHHVAFQQTLARYGDRDIIDLKGRVAMAVRQATPPSDLTIPDNRFARSGVRVALRQLTASQPLLPGLAAWTRAYDASRAEILESEGGIALHPHN